MILCYDFWTKQEEHDVWILKDVDLNQELQKNPARW